MDQDAVMSSGDDMHLLTSEGTRVRVTDSRSLARMAPVLDPFLGQSEVALLNDVPELAVKKALLYCRLYEYSKQTSNLQFPLESRRLEDHASHIDMQVVGDIQDDMPMLLALLQAAKVLMIEPLRQLAAAAIASFFRRRSYEDIVKLYDLNSEP